MFAPSANTIFTFPRSERIAQVLDDGTFEPMNESSSTRWIHSSFADRRTLRQTGWSMNSSGPD